MANKDHLEILRKGSEAWNTWRKDQDKIIPDLIEANLFRAKLAGADLSGAKLVQADLSGAKLIGADLSGANLSDATLYFTDLAGANLRGANISGAKLTGAKLVRADLSGASLYFTDLSGANLTGANLTEANLSKAFCIETDFTDATIEHSRIYGVSVWNIQKDGLKQNSLIITKHDEPVITVDDIEVAQLVHLLLNNESVRDVLDTITSKVVLILGRFSPERKAILDALRKELRHHNFTPIIFDFDKPSNKNFTETISTLAHMARFVIADITEARSIPQELQRIVPGLPSLPVQPLIFETQYEYGIFKDFLDYPWVLLPYRYNGLEELLASLAEKVVKPALDKSMEIEERRRFIEDELSKKNIL